METITAQVYLAKDNLIIKFFKLDLWSPGAGFFPIGTIGEEEKRFGL